MINHHNNSKISMSNKNISDIGKGDRGMTAQRRLFTSEIVTEGHPDKICDQISDAILDAIIEKDANARVACETTVTTGLVLVTGEITT